MRFAGMAWKLSPSDLTFLLEECQRCFWMKLAGGLPRPRAPFPKIFNLLDGQTKQFFRDKRTEEIAPGIKPGRVLHGDRWVRSGPIFVPGYASPVLLGGRFDTAFGYDDGTYGLVDFKTADPRSAHLALYGRQLHAYALAAEQAAPEGLELRPISQMGLLCVEPTAMEASGDGVAYRGEPHWIEIPRDDGQFMAFLSEVLCLLENPSPPEASENCAFCQYLSNGALSLLIAFHGPS